MGLADLVQDVKLGKCFFPGRVKLRPAAKKVFIRPVELKIFQFRWNGGDRADASRMCIVSRTFLFYLTLHVSRSRWVCF
ncbi:MAG: hypothetical protein DRO01_05285 [Thermoproteota archaeon]|nr:MAG: hypothetical protein DRO01_05285 [Candidatus Korarchaeota archaeon]